MVVSWPYRCQMRQGGNKETKKGAFATSRASAKTYCCEIGSCVSRVGLPMLKLSQSKAGRSVFRHRDYHGEEVKDELRKVALRGAQAG